MSMSSERLNMGSYTALSGLMSDHPEVFAIRMFSKLHTKNLLYYQAELAELEKELEAVEQADIKCTEGPRNGFGESWKSLTATGPSSLVVSDRAHLEDSRTRLQWSLMLRVRETLKEYDKALARYITICSSTRPPKSTSLKRLRQWLQTPEFGNSFLSGKPEGVWDIENGFRDFLVPTSQSEAVDGFAFHLTSLLTYLESVIRQGRQAKDELHTFSGSATASLNRSIVTTVSSMFPVLPIIVLFFVNDLLVRLGLVLTFTVLFAFVLVFGLEVTSEKTIAVTTAFAAIQVVFVGSTHSGLTSGNQPGS